MTDHPPDSEHLLAELSSLALALGDHEKMLNRRAAVTARLRELGVTWAACAEAANTTIPSLIQTVKRRPGGR